MREETDVGLIANERKGRRWFRLVVRCVAFATAVLLVSSVLPWGWTPMVVPALSPYVAICSTIAAGTVSVATLVGLPVLLIVLVRRRWLCRYLCPVGLATEHVGRLRPRGRSWSRWIPPLGRWIALATLGGAILGYPLALWLDPLAMFGGAFSLWSDPANLAGQVAGVALLTVLAISLVAPGAWCLRLCPLGATQELMAMPGRLCRKAHDEAEADPRQDAAPAVARRSVLSTGLGLVALAVGTRLAGAMVKQGRESNRTVLRPPGSVDERRFAGLCIRCGNCVRACPAGIIQPDLGNADMAGLFAPVVRFQDDYCHEDCRRCTEVCPSRAIAKLSLQQKMSSPIGLAKVDMSICYLADDRECSICKRECDYGAIEFVWSDEEYLPIPTVDPAKCPGCGRCEVFCPGTNDWERQASDQPVPLRKAIAVHQSRQS